MNSIIQSDILQQLLKNQKRFAEVAKPLLYPKTWEEFRNRELASYMSSEKGKKRLRKKKALKRMKGVWSSYLLTLPVSRFINYQEMGRKLFPVQPIPDAINPIYGIHLENEE